MPRKTQHVVPAKQGGWDVKKGGSSKATKHFEIKSEAVSYGKGVSKNQNAELVVHKKNGRIQNPNSYGNDPNPPKDKVK